MTKRERFAREMKHRVLDAPVDTPAILGDPVALEAWIRRYRQLTVDYLLESLSDVELMAWTEAWTALHEMVAPVWSKVSEGSSEREAWEAFDAETHLVVSRLYGQSSPEFRFAGFMPHYIGFARFLANAGAMDQAVATRIGAEYRALLGGSAAA